MQPGDAALHAASGAAPDAALRARRRVHWRGNLRTCAVLTLVWFVVTFGVAWFARELTFDFFGWPFAFWVGAQGAMIVYLLIIAVYARRMARLDAEFGAGEDG